MIGDDYLYRSDPPNPVPSGLSAVRVLRAYAQGRRGQVQLDSLTLGDYAPHNIRQAASRLVRAGDFRRVNLGVYEVTDGT